MIPNDDNYVAGYWVDGKQMLKKIVAWNERGLPLVVGGTCLIPASQITGYVGIRYSDVPTAIGGRERPSRHLGLTEFGEPEETCSCTPEKVTS